MRGKVISLVALSGRLFIQEIQRQTGMGPIHFDQFAKGGERDVGRLQIRTPEANIRHIGIGQG